MTAYSIWTCWKCCRSIIFNLLKLNSFIFILTKRLACKYLRILLWIWDYKNNMFWLFYDFQEQEFCRRPFQGCFWKHIFSTVQKQIHLCKRRKVWTLISPIITRGVFRTLSNIYNGVLFPKIVNGFLPF